MARILVTGKGTAGSWKIRGEQLGHAIGATIIPKADRGDCANADIIICVKRLNHRFFDNVSKSGKPWIWDLVDFYPQPYCTSWNRAEAINWIRKQIQFYIPDGIIWPNQRMRDDCDIGIPSTVIYHHHRPGLQEELNPIRTEVKAIGYEGAPDYLDDWIEPILRECQRRDWSFLINPPSITQLDAIIAVRGKAYNGYAQRSWKSNVKLANAQASGTPFICAREDSYLECSTGGELFVESPNDLRRVFDAVVPRGTRLNLSKALKIGSYSVADAASDLQDFIEVIQTL